MAPDKSAHICSSGNKSRGITVINVGRIIVSNKSTNLRVSRDRTGSVALVYGSSIIVSD